MCRICGRSRINTGCAVLHQKARSTHNALVRHLAVRPKFASAPARHPDRRHVVNRRMRPSHERAKRSVERLDIEDLFDPRVELDPGDFATVCRLDDGHAARQRRLPLGDGQVAEGRRFADLGQPDKRREHRQTPARGCTPAVPPPARLRQPERNRTSRPRPDSKSQTSSPRSRGEWGIDSPLRTVWPLLTSIKQPPAALPGRQPCGASVSPRAVTYLGPSLVALSAVQMTAIFGRQRRDERAAATAVRSCGCRPACTSTKTTC